MAKKKEEERKKLDEDSEGSGQRVSEMTKMMEKARLKHEQKCRDDLQ